MDYFTDISTNPTVTTLTVMSSPELTNSSGNLTCEEERNIFLSLASPRPGMLILFGIYFFGGGFGNGIIVLLFLTTKNLRTINNAFVTNLAFSDFLFVTLFTPLMFFNEYFRLRPFGKTFCYISIIINYSSQDVSIISMTALSYLRYRAVMRPLQIRRDGQKVTWLILVGCAVSWVVGIAAALYPATDCYVMPHFLTKCLLVGRHIIDSFTNNRHHLIFHSVRFVVFYILPLLVIASFHFMMAFKLRRTSFPLQRNASLPARRATRSRKRLGRIVLLIVVIFFLCWLPNYISWFTGLDDNVFVTWLIDVRSLTIFLPAFLNPALFFVMSSAYRKALFHTFSPSERHFASRLRTSSLTSSLVSLRLSRLSSRFSKRLSNVPSPT